ncbi:MAG: hypothetical protein KatS3mg077_2186 [Candidatus Binatia bacterium]|nr:MAG: hypothetical protein KatS3mg077_2186 [Candidatus Binatia bacterium]
MATRRRWMVEVLLLGLLATAPGGAVRADAGADNAPVFEPLLSDRLRVEVVDWFRPLPGRAPSGAQRYSFYGNQFRFGGKANLGVLAVVLEGQYTQLLGLPDNASLAAPEGNLGPGAVYFAHTHRRNQGEVFLKRGFLSVGNWKELPQAGAQLGRFEYSDGLETVPKDARLAWLKRVRVAERLVGPFGYTHVTRSFDGVRMAWDESRWNLTAFAARPTQGGFEISANRELAGTIVAGMAWTLKEQPELFPIDGRLFWLYYEDRRDRAVKVDNRPPAARVADRDDIALHTVGFHHIGVFPAGPGHADYLAWLAVQRGSWGELDHAAWGWSLEAGYQLPALPGGPWCRVGYTQTSGDGNPSDGQHETFFQLLPTARAYAQTPFFNLMNLEDLFVQLLVRPHERVHLRADGHWLRLNEAADLWYAGGGASNNTIFGFSGTPTGSHRELAYLVDLGIVFHLQSWLTAYTYYGHTFGQPVVGATFAGRQLDYGYVEVTARY